jgi:PIN domain nuclease of toxin-antitoxin system
MRYFIDTNIFLFYVAEQDQLDSNVAALFEDWENSFIISSESIREIAMLIKGGRLNDKIWRTYADVKNAIDKHGIEIRYVAESHLKTLFKLRPAPRHSDPADLMIIAQAITEGIPLISSDAKFPLYVRQGLNAILNKRPTVGR